MIYLSLPPGSNDATLRHGLHEAIEAGVDGVFFANPPLGGWHGPIAAASYAASIIDMPLGVGIRLSERHPLEIAEEISVLRAIVGQRLWVVFISETSDEASEILRFLGKDSLLRPEFPALSVGPWEAPHSQQPTDGLPVLMSVSHRGAGGDGVYGHAAELIAVAGQSIVPRVRVLIARQEELRSPNLGKVIAELRDSREPGAWKSIAEERLDSPPS